MAPGNEKDVVEVDANSGDQLPTCISIYNYIYIYIYIYTHIYICIHTLLGTDISSPRGTFEDDFPFPKVGYVSSPDP